MTTNISQHAITTAEKLIQAVRTFSNAFDAVENAEATLASAQDELQLANEDNGTTDAGEIYDRIQAATRNVSVKEIELGRANEERSKLRLPMLNTISVALPELLDGLRSQLADETGRLEGILKPLLPKSDSWGLRAMSEFIKHCTGVSELQNMLHRLGFALTFFESERTNPRPLLDQLQAALKML